MVALPLPFPAMKPVIRPVVRDAVARLAEGGIEERGAIFTRREVVDFILDLTGYTSDKPLKKGMLPPATRRHSRSIV